MCMLLNVSFHCQHIKDHHLFVFIGCLILIDLLLLVPWSGFHPMTNHAVELDAIVCFNLVL